MSFSPTPAHTMFVRESHPMTFVSFQLIPSFMVCFFQLAPSNSPIPFSVPAQTEPRLSTARQRTLFPQGPWSTVYFVHDPDWKTAAPPLVPIHTLPPLTGKIAFTALSGSPLSFVNILSPSFIFTAHPFGVPTQRAPDASNASAVTSVTARLPIAVRSFLSLPFTIFAEWSPDSVAIQRTSFE